MTHTFPKTGWIRSTMDRGEKLKLEFTFQNHLSSGWKNYEELLFILLILIDIHTTGALGISELPAIFSCFFLPLWPSRISPLVVFVSLWVAPISTLLLSLKSWKPSLLPVSVWSTANHHVLPTLHPRRVSSAHILLPSLCLQHLYIWVNSYFLKVPPISWASCICQEVTFFIHLVMLLGTL